MIKSNSNKNNKEITKHEKKEEQKTFRVDYIRTKQNSKVLAKDKLPNKINSLKTKPNNDNNKKTTNLNTNITTPKIRKNFNKENDLAKSQNRFLKIIESSTPNLNGNLTTKNKPINTKASFIKKIDSKKSVLEDIENEKMNTINKDDCQIINTMPNFTPSNKKLFQEYDQGFTTRGVTDKFTKTTKPPSMDKKNDLIKSSSNVRLRPNSGHVPITSPSKNNLFNKTTKNKLFKYTEKIIKELEESKIKDDNYFGTVENMEIQKVDFNFLDDDTGRILHTVNAYGEDNTNINLIYNTNTNTNRQSIKNIRNSLASPIRKVKKPSLVEIQKTTNFKKVTTSNRPKSEYRLKDKLEDNVGNKRIYSAKSNKASLNNFNKDKLNETPKVKENARARAKSSYKKPDVEFKLNEASLSTEASSIFRGRLEDYAIGKEIGKGAYAVVKQGLHKPTNKKVAIKIYEKIKLLDTQRKNSVKREITILKKLEHSNIVKLHEVIDNTKQVRIILKFRFCLLWN